MEKKWDNFGSSDSSTDSRVDVSRDASFAGYTNADASRYANDLDIPSFLSKRKPTVDEDLEKLKRKVSEYYTEFINGKNKDILTYLLFALYYLEDKDFNIDDLICFLNSKKEEIKANDTYMKLIVKLYNSLEDREIVSKRQLCDLLTDDYKKVVYSGMNIDVDLDMVNEEEVNEILEKDRVEKNIDKVLWYLCEKK